MGDSSYPEFLLDLGSNAMDSIVKQEPLQEMGPSSASVPIPGGHRGARGVYDQFSPSPLATSSAWGTRPDHMESPFKMDPDQLDSSFKMDDDDIFQVDKADLIQGPTLAELNANDDTLLGDLNFDDLLLPEERIQPLRVGTDLGPSVGSLFSGGPGFAPSSFPQSGLTYRSCPPYTNSSGFNLNGGISLIDTSEAVSPPAFPSPGTSNVAGSSTASSSTSPHPVSRPSGQSTLHDLLMRKGENPSSPMCSQMDTTVASSGKPKVSRLSMSAPTQSMGLEQIWARREPRQHLLSTGSLGLAEAGSTSSLSTGGALSPDPLGHLDPLSHDEGYEDSDEDSDHYDDYSSDNDSGGSDGEDQGGMKVGGPGGESARERHSKKERFFWQYNVQAKGPKGQRLVARARLEDPHVLNEATDPVFSPHCALRGIKHSGKARKGDGNDLTPNPRKLFNIGRELDKLSRVINDMTPVSELPFNVRPKTRKEKNKLASRACRLKKKAQHEANKIKLHGLEQEHRRLIYGISQAKQTLAAKLTETNLENQEELTRQMDKFCKYATRVTLGQFLRKELTRGYQLEHDEERYSARREKIYSFMKIPREVEKFMSYGFLQCADSFLFVYTFLPLRFLMALWAVAARPIMQCLGGKNTRGKKGERLLRPAEMCDLLKGVVVVGCWVAIWKVDTSMMYHLVKSQSVIKLYIFYNMLEVGDRLFSAFGQDTIDALLWTATEPRSRSHSHSQHLGTLPHLLFALAYVLLHSILVLFQATTLNVAINSSNKALLTIMMSNNFVELKGSVFKKFDKNNLFQLSCNDVRERFHLTMLLLAVSLQTMKEYAWRADRLAVLLPDCIFLLIAEVLVDWVKHAFITRFNELRSTVYRDYTVSLAYDMAQTRQEMAFSDPSDLVARRMGFIPLPLGVAMGRVISTTLTPAARPANIILFVLAYLILVALRILNSLIILGKACDLISLHTNANRSKSTSKPTPRDTETNNLDSNNPSLTMAIFSNSAVSLNNVCLNDALLKTEQSAKAEKAPESTDDISTAPKNVSRAGSEPLLPQ
ncbi:uncharacterized protein LOC107263074 [Cephus cinctus]|uniref:Uncharacterized protein LOC107263074 n=1 Tax=Cephus cinctus TaxID=211228 RepID=A0AAJ7VX06_CEPCN|nr:uncharacterized protein LOC107263074 [Cephus cinctus]